jgi:hypothetical protein
LRSLSAAAIESQNAQETGEAWLVLLEIDHDDLADPIRVVNNHQNITSNGYLFVGFPFEIELPGEDPDQPLRARLRIDNVDRTIVETVRTISSPPTVTARVVLASQPDTVEVEFSGMTLRKASYDAATVEADLVFEDVLNEPVTTNMTPAKYPGMF